MRRAERLFIGTRSHGVHSVIRVASKENRLLLLLLLPKQKIKTALHSGLTAGWCHTARNSGEEYANLLPELLLFAAAISVDDGKQLTQTVPPHPNPQDKQLQSRFTGENSSNRNAPCCGVCGGVLTMFEFSASCSARQGCNKLVHNTRFAGPRPHNHSSNGITARSACELNYCE